MQAPNILCMTKEFRKVDTNFTLKVFEKCMYVSYLNITNITILFYKWLKHNKSAHEKIDNLMV